MLKGPHTTKSPLTVCLLLVLSIMFLAPLYHSHQHTGDYHQEYSDDHMLLHDRAGLKGLQHNSSHLHIKKDIGRTDTRLSYKSSSLKPALFFVSESPVFTKYLSCTFAKHAKKFIFRSNSRNCLSGLSPPAA